MRMRMLIMALATFFLLHLFVLVWRPKSCLLSKIFFQFVNAFANFGFRFRFAGKKHFIQFLNVFRNEIVDRLLPIVVFLEVFSGLWCSSFVASLSDKHNGERAAALVFRLAEEERAALDFGIPLGFGFEGVC